ncbi:MAG TPA: PTS sugar transporter subunit IIB [Hyalangium sp.]|nr:PTS sugar transporter subunit IIB [Hyalangium sp.]
MITLVRVDNRLIHGQVVEAWLPHLKVQRVIVADDEAAASPLIRAAMALAVQSAIEVQILPLAQVDFASISKDGVRTLVLLRDVAAVPFAHAHGLAMDQLNLGNVHFGTGRRQVSPSVFLAEAELKTLQGLADNGVRVEARAVPSEKSVELGELAERWMKGG